MPKIAFEEVIAAMAHVDDPDVLAKKATSTALQIALEMVRPKNWWGSATNPETLLLISYAEGIPVAWVPRAEIVRDLSHAVNSEARLDLLLDRTDQVVEDCLEALDECKDPYLGGDIDLAVKAVKAFQDGHHEAGMALAVSLGEPLAKWASRPRVLSFDTADQQASWIEHKRLMEIETKSEYQWAEWQFSGVGFDSSRISFKEKVVMGPVPRFFTPYYTNRGDAPPGWLARHPVAHNPTQSQFTRRNALISLMLISSLLREQQSWCEQIHEMEDFVE